MDPNYANTNLRIQRPDIKTRNLAFNFFWNLNEKDFSQKVAFDQSGTQENSEWGWSAIGHLSQSSIRGETPFVPSTASDQFGKLANIKSVLRNTAAAGIGVGGILVYQHFYLAGMLAIGLGAQTGSIEGSGVDIVNQNGTFASSRISTGFNGKKNVLSFQILTDGVTTPYEEGEVRSSSLALSLLYACRFEGFDLPTLNKFSSILD